MFFGFLVAFICDGGAGEGAGGIEMEGDRDRDGGGIEIEMEGDRDRVSSWIFNIFSYWIWKDIIKIEKYSRIQKVPMN